MTTDTDIKYETKTVRAVRGMESRTIEKWEGEGWQVVSQVPAKIRTEIMFRRPVPKSRPLLWIACGGVLTIALATVIVIGVLGEKDSSPAEPAIPSSTAVATPDAQSSPEVAAPAPSPGPDDSVLTAENNPELAAMLASTDYCSPDIATFAEAYRGRTISFAGSIVTMAPHEGATTRYDILIGVGDFSEASARGPAFQFRDENTVGDLNWVGSVPDTITVGTNLDVTAEVDRFEARSCLFLLEPIATAVR